MLSGRESRTPVESLPVYDSIAAPEHGCNLWTNRIIGWNLHLVRESAPFLKCFLHFCFLPLHLFSIKQADLCLHPRLRPPLDTSDSDNPGSRSAHSTFPRRRAGRFRIRSRCTQLPYSSLQLLPLRIVVVDAAVNIIDSGLSLMYKREAALPIMVVSASMTLALLAELFQSVESFRFRYIIL